MNYERLVGKRHGLLLEGYYSFSGSSERTKTIGLSYRYHFKPSLGGFFVNTFYRFGNVYFSDNLKENNTENSYKMNTILNLAGLGAGYRLQLKNGLAGTARIGYGYQFSANYSWFPGLPANKSDQARIEALQGMDLELSIGYSF